MNDTYSVLWVVRPCRGGMLTHVDQILRRLDPQRVTVRLASTTRVIKEVSAHRAVTDVYPLTTGRQFTATRTIVSAGRKLCTIMRHLRPSVCHGHGFAAGLLLAAAKAVTNQPSQVLLTAHNVLSDRLPQKLLASHLISRSSLTVCAVSRAVAASWAEVLPSSKIQTVPNGWPAPQLSAEDVSFRNTGRLNLLYVGRLTTPKGVSDLLKAAEILTSDGVQFHLDIVGDGPQRKKLQRKCTQQLAGHVTFHGWKENVDQHYRRSDALILPSLAEGAGLVLAEAMSFGLPVVASRTGGITEMIQHGRSGLLVQPGSPRQLAHAARLLAGRISLRRRLALGALLECSRRPRWGDVARQWERLYAAARHKTCSVALQS